MYHSDFLVVDWFVFVGLIFLFYVNNIYLWFVKSFCGLCQYLFGMVFFVNFVNDDNFKACFSKHSQWPPKSFRLRQA
ncbi:hypothetical protein CsatB_009947 [Cannabis sativa]